ncbi:MAG: hypothetical protein AAFY00_02630, partial [Bacteroidota bacterium]
VYSYNWIPNSVVHWATRFWKFPQADYMNRQRHGYQKKWYPNGQITSITHFNLGKEEGLQQAWLKTGKLYVNYEAKNGRFFGLRRSNLCYQLKDEVVQK